MTKQPIKTHYALAILLYGLAALFLFYEMGLQVLPSVMTHLLMRDLRIDAAGLGLMSSVYFLTYTLMQIPAGLLFDRYPIRIILTLALLTCLMGTVLFGAMHHLLFVGSGRFLMGIGSAFAFVGVSMVAVKWFPPRYFAFLIGIAQLLAAIGALSGEAPIAIAVNHFGWQITWYNLLVAGALLMLAIFLCMRENPQSLHHRTSSTAFGILQSLRLILKEPQTWWVAMYAFFNWAPITIFAALWGVPYLMTYYHLSNTEAGWLIAVIWIGLGLTSPFLGWFSDRLKRRCILLNFCALLGLGSTLLLLLLPQISIPITVLCLVGFGIATSGQILSFAVVRDLNAPRVTATALGLNNMAVVAGGAIFQPLVGYILRSVWTGLKEQGVPIYSAHNYQIALLIVPLCFALCWVASQFFIKETYCRPKFEV